MMMRAVMGCMLVSVLIYLTGCGHTYTRLEAEQVLEAPERFEGAHVILKGIPQIEERGFVRPSIRSDGFWQVKVDGVRCVQWVNFENAPRIDAMRWLAAAAQRNGREVIVRGKFHKGVLELQDFEGLMATTPWYRNDHPVYSYTRYYAWHPFGYLPNGRVFLP